jgi:transposase
VPDWLPDDHLVWCVLDVVAELDLSASPGRVSDGRSRRGCLRPEVMLAVRIYAYACGERSSRRIERRLVEDVAFRVVAANLQSDHAPSRGCARSTRTRSCSCSGRYWRYVL